MKHYLFCIICRQGMHFVPRELISMRPERAKGALWKSAIFVRRRRLSRVEAEGVFPILLILLLTSSSFGDEKRRRCQADVFASTSKGCDFFGVPQRTGSMTSYVISSVVTKSWGLLAMRHRQSKYGCRKCDFLQSLAFPR